MQTKKADTFTEKVKAIFLANNTQSDISDEKISSQSIPLFKASVETGNTSEEEENGTTSTVLSATTGALRLSTEEQDFPIDDTINVYEVKKDDTIAKVAALFNVSKNTIIWANNLKSEKLIPGDTLVILPVTGIRHTVKKGDTVATIAKKYKADQDDIATYNGIIKTKVLEVGGIVLVPDGEIAAIAQAPTKTTSKTTKTTKTTMLATAQAGFFVRPLVGGIKTQGIHGRNAVDIAAPVGTSVVASASGKVLIAKMGGNNGGYGNMIVISHSNGTQTLYAHLSSIQITQGQTVTQGQVIGAVGSTGRSTGSHLHFEIRGAVNPF